MPVKGLIFDAYGTLYDVHSVHAKTEELCPGKGDLITQIWRLKQLEYTWLQTSLQEYRDFTYLTQVSLEFALRAAGVEPQRGIGGDDQGGAGSRERDRRWPQSRGVAPGGAGLAPSARGGSPPCFALD
jgi:FMN phosphatase YigB (HAD superfamily)